MALRVFACARGRTRSFHAVCVEKGMRGAGRACIGVWECWGARRRVGRCPKGVFGVLKELLFTAWDLAYTSTRYTERQGGRETGGGE